MHSSLENSLYFGYSIKRVCVNVTGFTPFTRNCGAREKIHPTLIFKGLLCQYNIYFLALILYLLGLYISGL